MAAPASSSNPLSPRLNSTKKHLSQQNLDELSLTPKLTTPVQASLYIRVQVHVLDDQNEQINIGPDCEYDSNRVEVFKIQPSIGFSLKELFTRLSEKIEGLPQFQANREKIGQALGKVPLMVKMDGLTVYWDWKYIPGASNEGGETEINEKNLRSVWALLSEPARKGRDLLMLNCSLE